MQFPIFLQKRKGVKDRDYFFVLNGNASVQTKKWD
jgi:hypothetical protein